MRTQKPLKEALDFVRNSNCLIGCVYPQNASSYYINSNIDTHLKCINITCADGDFYAYPLNMYAFEIIKSICK